jgi:hypothetical protein
MSRKHRLLILQHLFQSSSFQYRKHQRECAADATSIHSNIPHYISWALSEEEAAAHCTDTSERDNNADGQLRELEEGTNNGATDEVEQTADEEGGENEEKCGVCLNSHGTSIRDPCSYSVKRSRSDDTPAFSLRR